MRELGGRCQVCGDVAQVERMHLLRGVWKEDDVELVMLGCGDFGRCRIHPRHTREDVDQAALEIRAVMTPTQECAIISRIGRDGLDRLYPDQGGKP